MKTNNNNKVFHAAEYEFFPHKFWITLKEYPDSC